MKIDRKRNWPTFCRYLAFIYAPLLIITGILFTIVYLLISEDQQESRKRLEEERINHIKDTIVIDLESVISDLLILSEAAGLRLFFKNNDHLSLKTTKDLFISFSENKKLYDQIRFIDEKGMEVIRVDFNAGSPGIVPQTHLQNKTNRYYFKETYKIGKGEIYVSPLDLNVERGEIELPFKPMIRIGTPVFDDLGDRKGIIVINYLAESMLRLLGLEYNYPLSYVMLLNEDGHWLKGRTSEEEFGFMFKEKKDRTFGQQFPEVWKTIADRDYGQIVTADGLFTFVTIHPLSEATMQGSYFGKIMVGDEKVTVQKGYYWKLVLQVRQDLFTRESNDLLLTLIAWYIGVSLILFVLSVALAYTSLVRKLAAKQNIHFKLALADSEKRYREIVQTSNSIILKIDSRFKLSFINQFGLDFFGFEENEVIGKSPNETMIPPVDGTGTSLEKLMENMVKNPKAHHTHENQNIKKNGELVWIFWQNKISYDEKGNFLEILSVGQDITERRQKEVELRKLSEAVFQNDSVVVITGLDGSIEYINPAFTKVTGYTKEEAIGRNPRILKSDHHPPEFYQKMWQTISNGETWRGEIVNKKKNGESFCETAIISPVKDPSGKISHYVAIKDDITDLKNAESALMESERYRESILKTTIEGFWLIDNNAITLDVNQAMCDILGRAKEEIIGTATFRYFDEENRKILQKELDARKYGKTGAYEISVTKPDGSLVPCFFSANPWYDKNGKRMGSFAMVSNISTQKKTEEKLHMAKRTADMANHAKSQFLANMSHELRTPLNGIIGFSQVLEMQISKNLSAKQKEYFKNIRESSDHLLEMVNDILDLSKIEAGRTNVNLDFFDFGALLERSPGIIQAMAQKKGLRVIVDIAPNLGWINGDKTRLKQVLYNLLSNAVKFTESNKSIGINAHHDDKNFIISIWDEGVGIPEEEFEKIFDPFEQVNGGRTSNEGGTGLGLAISKKLVELHGGNISLSSLINKGSRFTITLPGRVVPSALEESPSKIQAGPADDQLTQGMRILVTEDNETNMKLLEAFLVPTGSRLDMAASGEEALKLVTEKKYDLILMDIQLPGIDGIETMKRIKQLGKEIPIIAVTAFAMKGDEEKYLKEGFDYYISKPISIESLQKAIRKAISNSAGDNSDVMIVD